MATVIKRPNRQSLYAVFRDSAGRQVWRSTGTINRKDAQEIANQLERADKLAGHGLLTKSRAQELLNEVLRRIEPDETLFSSSVEVYLKEWLVNKETSGKAESSLARYKGVANSFLRSLGTKGRRPIAAVTRQDVEKWRKTLLSEGRAATTVNWSVKVLGGALERAVRDGDLKLNPAKAIERIEGITAEADERIPFTSPQVRSLLKVAGNEWKGMILLAYHCGMRLTDAAGLTWQAVDLTARTITFRPKKTASRRNGGVKVVMHSDVLKFLEGLPAGDNPDQPLFPTLKGRTSGSSAGLSNEFKRMIEKAKIRQIYGATKEGKGRQLSLLSFHSLRHAFVSKAHQAAEGKVSQEVLKGMSGHSTDAAHQVYVHLQTEEQRAVVAAFESVL